MKIKCQNCHHEIDLEGFAKLNKFSIEEAKKNIKFCGQCGHRLINPKAEIIEEKIIEEEFRECIKRIKKRFNPS